jgi:hypothetical protein
MEVVQLHFIVKYFFCNCFAKASQLGGWYVTAVFQITNNYTTQYFSSGVSMRKTAISGDKHENG